MGLDITAYRDLSKIDHPELDADGNPTDWETQFRTRHLDSCEKNFPGRSAGLENDAVYTFAEKFGFGAGSYSGYNQWRDMLAELAGYAGAKDCRHNHESGPFWELINFYDNEGTIGPVVAAKLVEDFAEFKNKAAALGENWFFDCYCCWEKAFIMAADSGAVDFH